MTLNLKSFLLFLFVCLINLPLLEAQIFTSDNNTPKRNSPYSRIGLGDIADQNFVSVASMGGLASAFNDPFQVNLTNPASIAFLKSASFEVGGFFKYGKLNNEDASINTFAGNFGYISIGFPMINEINLQLDRKDPLLDWRMNFALLPYSNVGYNVESRTPIELDTAITTFTGKGGTYKLLWTNALKYKDFAFGINAGYLFGNTINEREIYLNSVTNTYFNNLVDNISYSGLVWSFGAQYKHQFKEMNDEKELVNSGRSITIGAYLNSKGEVNTNSNQFYRRINPTFTIADTLRNVQDVEGTAVLPGQFGIGVIYEKLNKFRVGLDYSASKWSNYKNDAKNDVLLDSYRVAAGAEYLPNKNSYNKYLDKVRYRIGVFYEKDPRKDEFNEQLTAAGIVLGAGMPLTLPRGQTSFFNLGIEAGKFGSADSLNETYIKINLGFTLNDNYWFYKRKFN